MISGDQDKQNLSVGVIDGSVRGGAGRRSGSSARHVAPVGMGERVLWRECSTDNN